MKSTTILYVVLALVVGFGAGYFVFQGAPEANLGTVEQAPVLKSNWDNRVVTSWQAVVIGKLTARDANSFTLSDGGSSVTLPLAQGTVFSDSRDFTKAVDFTAVPLGTTIKGFVNVDREKGIFGSGTYTVQFE